MKKREFKKALEEARVFGEIDDTMSRWIDVNYPDATDDQRQELIHAYTKGMWNEGVKEVVLEMRGGLIDYASEPFPDGVVVVVRDYDVEGADEEELKEDDEGRLYNDLIFKN